MLKELIWSTFESTGFIDSYMFYRQLSDSGESEKNVSAEEEAAVVKAVE